LPFASLPRGGRVHYAERGQPRDGAAPVLLVHGAGASSAVWAIVMSRLARVARAVAIDLPGHGASPPPGDATSLTLAGYRDSVGALSEALALGPSVLVGHSMGGMVAIDAALTWPEKVEALVLCGTAPRLPVREDLLALIREDHARVPEWMAEHGLSPRVKPAVRRGFVAAGTVTPADVMLADFAAVRATDLTARLHALSCPLVWLDGADDRIAPAHGGRPGDVRTLEGVGHVVPVEAPGAVVEAVTALLDM
jgi:pimeloyl-ACP methyl ester carboxylesterase